jgi:tyrosyl-DNA phosphodiesterase-1
MTQAAWSSPLLPLRPSIVTLNSSDTSEDTHHPIGSGERFKIDILRYFKAYGKRVAKMTEQLVGYDFSSIRAAFIGSAPSRQKPPEAKPSGRTSFGWLGLQEVLSTVPITAPSKQTESPPHIILQVSSIATLGAAPTWLTNFQSALARSTNSSTKQLRASPFFAKLEPSKQALIPEFNIIFPTPDEICTSLDGYASGASIHTKLQSAQQQKQLEYLHPLFCHWKPSTDSKAMRGPAAPHIKTYIRFTDTSHETIDWALLTSANMSKQAWGDVCNKNGEVWIQSWEAGVVVWPELFSEKEEEGNVVMVPVFGKDMLDDQDETSGAEGKKRVVGLRMPYDLPLTSYAEDEKPWCATMQYTAPDWKGLAWGGY